MSSTIIKEIQKNFENLQNRLLMQEERFQLSIVSHFQQIETFMSNVDVRLINIESELNLNPNKRRRLSVENAVDHFLTTRNKQV